MTELLGVDELPDRVWPPIWPDATLPVVATRFSQLIAVLSLTPKRAAA